MSRSRRPRCGRGRGCGCCGDAGAARRRRERAWARADGVHVPNGTTAKDTGGCFHHDYYYQGKKHK